MKLTKSKLQQIIKEELSQMIEGIGWAKGSDYKSGFGSKVTIHSSSKDADGPVGKAIKLSPEEQYRAWGVYAPQFGRLMLQSNLYLDPEDAQDLAAKASSQPGWSDLEVKQVKDVKDGTERAAGQSLEILLQGRG
jgi:hypothetical protein